MSVLFVNTKGRVAYLFSRSTRTLCEPGGKLAAGEEPETGLERECREEGAPLAPDWVASATSDFNLHNGSTHRFYLVEVKSDPFTPAGSGEDRFLRSHPVPVALLLTGLPSFEVGAHTYTLHGRAADCVSSFQRALLRSSEPEGMKMLVRIGSGTPSLRLEGTVILIDEEGRIFYSRQNGDRAPTNQRYDGPALPELRFVGCLGYALEPHPLVVSGGASSGCAQYGLRFTGDVPARYSLKTFLHTVQCGRPPNASLLPSTGHDCHPSWAENALRKGEGQWTDVHHWPRPALMRRQPYGAAIVCRAVSTNLTASFHTTFLTSDGRVRDCFEGFGARVVFFPPTEALDRVSLRLNVELRAIAVVERTTEGVASTANALADALSREFLVGITAYVIPEPQLVELWVHTNTRAAHADIERRNPLALGAAASDGGISSHPLAVARFVRDVLDFFPFKTFFEAYEKTDPAHRGHASRFIDHNMDIPGSFPQHESTGASTGGVVFSTMQPNPPVVLYTKDPPLTVQALANALRPHHPHECLEMMCDVILSMYRYPAMGVFVNYDTQQLMDSISNAAISDSAVWAYDDRPGAYRLGGVDIIRGPTPPQDVTFVEFRTFARLAAAGADVRAFKPVHVPNL